VTGRRSKRSTGPVLQPQMRDFATFERTLRAATAAQGRRVRRPLTKGEVAAIANDLLADPGTVWELVSPGADLFEPAIAHNRRQERRRSALAALTVLVLVVAVWAGATRHSPLSRPAAVAVATTVR
jgi:hypothetical protein